MSNSLIENYIARLPEGLDVARPLYRFDGDRVAGLFYACHLTSVFQPVVQRAALSASDGTVSPVGKVLGHAAYVRCHNGEDLSPWNLFAQAADDEELVQLDRLARTVHAINYFHAAGDEGRLFLQVDARLLAAVHSEHGKTFEGVLRGLGVAPERVVIVLPDLPEATAHLLPVVAANYRLRGYRVSVRYRGTDTAGLARLEAFRPHIVALRQAAPDLLQRQIEVVHAFGGVALVTHIEAANDLSTAAELGADWFQGYALGRPQPLRRECIEPKRPGRVDPPPSPPDDGERRSRIVKVESNDWEILTMGPLI